MGTDASARNPAAPRSAELPFGAKSPSGNSLALDRTHVSAA